MSGEHWIYYDLFLQRVAPYLAANAATFMFVAGLIALHKRNYPRSTALGLLFWPLFFLAVGAYFATHGKRAVAVSAPAGTAALSATAASDLRKLPSSLGELATIATPRR